jgi:hypothetical protein
MVGKEGFAEDDLILKAGIAPYRVMTQFSCEALRVEAEALFGEFNRGARCRTS